MARPAISLGATITRRSFMKVASATTIGATAFLSACGGSSGTDQTITLNHWYSTPGEKGAPEAAKHYADQYHQSNPNITVKVTMIPSDYATKLGTGLVSPQPPDVFELGPGPTYAQVKAGLIEPLDDLYTADVKSQFHPQDLEQLSMGGHTYGVKTLEDFAFIYYRKSLFAKAGITVPTTLDELIAAAKALTTGNVKGLFLGNAGGARGYVYYLQAPWAAGVKLIDNNQVGFKSDKLATVLTKLHQLDTSGYLLDGAPTDSFDPGAFNSGLCAMQWCGMWAMPAVKQQWGDDFDVFPFPSLDATIKPGVWYAGWSNCISAKSQHKTEAKQYLKWLAIDNTQVQIDWNTAYGFHVPPRLSAAAQAEKLKSGTALKGVQLLQQYGQVTSPLFDDKMYTAFSTAVSNAVTKGNNPKDELNTAYQACTQELQQELG